MLRKTKCHSVDPYGQPSPWTKPVKIRNTIDYLRTNKDRPRFIWGTVLHKHILSRPSVSLL